MCNIVGNLGAPSSAVCLDPFLELVVIFARTEVASGADNQLGENAHCGIGRATEGLEAFSGTRGGGGRKWKWICEVGRVLYY